MTINGDTIDTFESLVCQFLPREHRCLSDSIPKLKEEHKDIVFQCWHDGITPSEAADEIIGIEKTLLLMA